MSGFGYNVLGFGANAAAGGGGPSGPSDDEFNRTSFLSHFEGSNNGVNNAFDDGSDSNHTITANGNVIQGSFGPFARPDGEWGVDFDGSDYLDANDGVTFGTGAFTIEFFVYLKANTQQFFFDARPDGANTTYPVIYMLSNRTLVYYANSSDRITSSTSEKLSEYTWHHIAVCRSGTSTKMFLDGTQVGSTYSDSTNYADSGRMRIGANKNEGNDLDGYMSNVRVVNSALYTSNFTPPTAALTAITDTKLLTCQSNRFVDNSADGLTITPEGDPAVTAFGPLLTSAVYDPAVNGANAYFDGTGDDLVAANSTDFDLSSGDFTISMWVYPDSSSPTGNIEGLITKAVYSASGSSGWQLWWQTFGTPKLRFLAFGSNQYFSGPTFYGNQWSYVTVVRTGNTLKLFLNGVEGLSSSISDFTNSTGTLTIGSTTNWSTTDNYFSGYMCDVFICKGTAVYTSNFTPPTAPLTAITNTKLLLNMADGQAIDSTAQDNIKLETGAKISTAQYKFGTSSILFDAEADNRASFKTTPFGTGDWTIEGFFRKVAEKDDNDSIWDTRNTGQSGLGHLTLIDDTTAGQTREIYFYNGQTQFRCGSASALSLNTWYHIAVCRSGTSLRVFLDGTQVGSTFSDSTDYINDYFSLGNFGANVSAARGWDGYVDEFRISYMARYTANFIAPSEPFADKGQ